MLLQQQFSLWNIYYLFHVFLCYYKSKVCVIIIICSLSNNFVNNNSIKVIFCVLHGWWIKLSRLVAYSPHNCTVLFVATCHKKTFKCFERFFPQQVMHEKENCTKKETRFYLDMQIEKFWRTRQVMSLFKIVFYAVKNMTHFCCSHMHKHKLKFLCQFRRYHPEYLRNINHILSYSTAAKF